MVEDTDGLEMFQEGLGLALENIGKAVQGIIERVGEAAILKADDNTLEDILRPLLGLEMPKDIDAEFASVLEDMTGTRTYYDLFAGLGYLDQDFKLTANGIRAFRKEALIMLKEKLKGDPTISSQL